MNDIFDVKSSDDPLEVSAEIRRYEGRLLIIGFDHPRPAGWGAEGATLRIQRHIDDRGALTSLGCLGMLRGRPIQ
jgi:hypothetical protein